MSYDHGPALNCTSPLYAGCYLKWILLANERKFSRQNEALWHAARFQSRAAWGKNNLIISLVAVPCRVNGKAY